MVRTLFLAVQLFALMACIPESEQRQSRAPDEQKREICQALQDKALDQVTSCENVCQLFPIKAECLACVESCAWENVDLWKLAEVRCRPLVGSYEAKASCPEAASAAGGST